MSSNFAPLRHAPFRFLLAGRTVNALGNSFAPLALAFAVLDLTGSVTDLGLVVGARTLVNVAFLLFGGVLADRMPKHLLMVGASLAAAVTQGVVAVLVLTGEATIPLLIGLGAINGMVGALALPASSSILPQTVPAEIRQQANAMNRLGLNSAAILGAPLAGVIVAATNPGWGIAVDAVTFALAGLLFLPLRSITAVRPVQPVTPPVPAEGVPAVEPARPNVFADLRTGWSEFRSRTWLWVVVAGAALGNAVWSGGLYVLGPVVADDTIGRRAWGVVLAAQTAGMIVGALIAMRLRLRRMLLVGCVSLFGMALPLLLLGAYPNLWALIAGAAVAGLTLEQFGVAWETTMQEHIPPDKLARVYSYDMVGSFVAMPIGELAAGPVAHVFGVRPTLVGAGVLMAVSVAAMLLSRDVRTLAHKLPESPAGTVKESVA
ncbi:MFS transporter [Paractinoplanes brasiliensis]|uniref:Putative MFS family arabinose efflux permease n=1 Tax=Paractinoplanes brasiliensis TaxID=52695 RepID=A0A4R6JTA9_9ACTN|nr:MFS transporter [Actinoplanes brasiliensis]TDO39347.1 putative MFS family arabinose efflux permease [Actinoplanes brasiliensis]GID32632.1 MFS transporter [Actinoplanes brasiliensis]